MNILHYSVLNENHLMVELIVHADAEGGRLMSEKNFRDETPVNLDDKGRYEMYWRHIWDAASNGSASSLENLIKNKKYTVN